MPGVEASFFMLSGWIIISMLRSFNTIFCHAPDLKSNNDLKAINV